MINSYFYNKSKLNKPTTLSLLDDLHSWGNKSILNLNDQIYRVIGISNYLKLFVINFGEKVDALKKFLQHQKLSEICLTFTSTINANFDILKPFVAQIKDGYKYQYSMIGNCVVLNNVQVENYLKTSFLIPMTGRFSDDELFLYEYAAINEGVLSSMYSKGCFDFIIFQHDKDKKVIKTHIGTNRSYSILRDDRKFIRASAFTDTRNYQPKNIIKVWDNEKKICQDLINPFSKEAIDDIKEKNTAIMTLNDLDRQEDMGFNNTYHRHNHYPSSNERYKDWINTPRETKPEKIVKVYNITE